MSRRRSPLLPIAASLALFAASLALFAAPSGAGADACEGGNLLRSARNPGSDATGELALVTDGWLVPDGKPATQADAARVSDGARLRYRLEPPREVVGLYVQADAGARFDIVLEDDAGHASRVELDPVEGAGLRGRGQLFEARRVRSLELTARGAPSVAISEVGLYACDAAMREAARWTRHRPDPDPRLERKQRLAAGKLAFGLLALALLLAAERWSSARRVRGLRIGVCLLALLSWLDFGTFTAQPRGVLHTWDSAHYFLGSKYAPEVGYERLYECVAASGRRRGLGAWLDRGHMRRLEDERRVPGTYSRSSETRCPMSEARRAELDQDLTRFAAVGMPFGMPPEGITNDRGYLASPFGTAWLRLFTEHATPSRTFFITAAILDGLLLVGAVVALGLGLGLGPAAYVALALGVGAPWDFEWLGGTLDRHTWFFALALAMVALHRRWPVVAAVALAFAALHRVFPAAFALGAIAAPLAVQARTRTWSRADARLVVGFVASVGLFALASCVLVGASAWPEFFSRLALHRTAPVANELGLPAALRVFGGDLDRLLDASQLDPLVPWERRVLALDAALLPLRLLGLLACGWLAARAWRARASALPMAFLGLLALLCLTNVASYYGQALMLAAAIPGLGRLGRGGIVTAALATQLLSLSPDTPSLERFAWISIAVLASVALALVLATRGESILPPEGEGASLRRSGPHPAPEPHIRGEP